MKTALLTLQLLFCLLALLFVGPAGAAELDQRLFRISSVMSAAIEAEYPAAVPVAVFPFSMDEKLKRKRVDLAIETMLSDALMRTSRFTVLERSRIEAVFIEQRLALSGAVENDTAVRVGKLTGARLLVLGSVARLGKSYQINARLVDAETGEVVASQFEEVPVEAFDEDASRYIVLVPEVQRLGIYIGQLYARGKVQKIPPAHPFGATISPSNEKAEFQGYGFGARYWPASRWMTDFFVYSKFQDDAGNVFNYAGDDANAIPSGKLYTHYGYRFVLNRVFPGDRVNLYLGVGWEKIRFHFLSMPRGVCWSANADGIRICSAKSAANVSIPLVRAGAEWRPQRRIGLGLFGNYSLTSPAVRMNGYFLNDSGSIEEVLLRKVSFPRLTVEGTLAFYF